MTVHAPRLRFTRSALYVALALLTVAFWPAPAVAQDGRLEARVFDIARQLRCPVCVSESVADSNARVSIEMRDIVQQQLEDGRTEAQILAYFQERYGDWILLEPPRRGIHLLVWLLPAVVALAGAAALGLYVRSWLAKGRETPDVDEADLQRVRDALEARDGRGAGGAP